MSRDHLYKKGQSGNPAGKPKGSKNKPKFSVMQTCADQKFDPCMELINIVRTPGASLHAKVQACIDIMAYMDAKNKPKDSETGSTDDRYVLHMNFGEPDKNAKTTVDGFDNV
jgi:hypothetical protein